MTRRVLIITVGETPQVVTETVYALLARENPWIPDQILLATTSRGEERFVSGNPATGLAPLVGAQGRLKVLYEVLGIVDHYVEPTVFPARRGSGAIVGDIRSDEEVSAFADTLLNLVRDVTADAKSQLHLSLAGGRKTMSYIAGAVMSLYGRKGDELSHVLVEPVSYESTPGFWWPGQPDPVVLTDRSGKPNGETLDPARATVLLHTVPFVRLRAYLPDDEAFGGGGGMTFDQAVRRADEALSIERLVVDIPNRFLRVGRYSLKVEPAWIALFAAVAEAGQAGEGLKSSGRKPDRRVLRAGSADRFLKSWARYRAVTQVRTLYQEPDDDDLSVFPGPFEDACRIAIRDFTYEQDVSVPLSKIRRLARDAFPKELASRVLAGKPEVETKFNGAQIEILLPRGTAGFFNG